MTLSEKRCLACEGGVAALSASESQALLKQLKNWTVSDNHQEITKVFQFKNYYQTMAFVNALAWISHAENHHPDLSVHYNKCVVLYTTHAISGLSENDFICAAKADQLNESA